MAIIRSRPIAGGQVDAACHAAWYVSLNGPEFTDPRLDTRRLIQAVHGGDSCVVPELGYTLAVFVGFGALPEPQNEPDPCTAFYRRVFPRCGGRRS